MSDRPGNQRPTPENDDDLAYLDAGLSEDDSDGTSRTARFDQSPAQSPRPTTAADMSEQSGRGRSDATSPPSVVVASPLVRDRNWTWPIINTVGLLVVIAVNFLANALEFNGQTTGDVVRVDSVPFQPEDWVFTIWGAIYILLLLFVIYGLLPAGRRNVRLQRISPLFLIANIANVTWLVLWHWEQFLPSLITILVLLGSLLGIYIGLRIKNPIRRSTYTEKPGWFKRLVMWAPFSVYLGWICVATLANLMVWLDRSGWDGGPFSYNLWAAIFIAAGTLTAAIFVFTAKDVLMPLVFAVAFAGIADQNWGETALVSIVAIVFAVVCVGLAGIASVIAFDRDADRGLFGRSKSDDVPRSTTSDDNPPVERA
jgi:hypothetical protein